MCDIKKEFYKLDRSKPMVGLLMMLKNEEKRLHVSLESVVGHVDAIIIYDTGSTDNTINILEEFSEKHKINLYLKKGEFVNFAVSRNECLDFADTIDVTYLILLDCNDELREGKNLREVAEKYFDKDTNCFLVCQQWWSGVLDKYYNTRLIKARQGMRYVGSVHEYLKDTFSETEQPRFQVVRLENIILYQDRTKDDDKSKKRFTRDRELLLADYKKNPKEPRTLFYLAQTCQCLGNHDEALYYSKLRLEVEGFIEEKFHSYIRCGDSSVALQHNPEDCIKWYIKAYEEFQRAEALVRIVQIYKNKIDNLIKENKPLNNYWRIAYMYIHEACKLKYPDHCILFVDKSIYDYRRWHLMGIIAYYVGEYEEGRQACLKALEFGLDKELNEHNLKFHEEKLNINKVEDVSKMTRSQFIFKKLEQLQKEFPKMTRAQLVNKATMQWKKLRNLK